MYLIASLRVLHKLKTKHNVLLAEQPMNRVKKKRTSITNSLEKYDDTELWETGKLGATAKYVGRVSLEETKRVHKALGIESITVRLEKKIVDKLKLLAKEEGVIFQALIRSLLTKYANASTAKNVRKGK